MVFPLLLYGPRSSFNGGVGGTLIRLADHERFNSSTSAQRSSCSKAVRRGYGPQRGLRLLKAFAIFSEESNQSRHNPRIEDRVMLAFSSQGHPGVVGPQQVERTPARHLPQRRLKQMSKQVDYGTG
jgi:hypothetical protein